MRETLRRIGKISWEGEIRTHTASPWNYRNQAEIKISRLPDGRAELGFFEAESHRLRAIDTCLILSPRLSAVLGALRGDEWREAVAECSEIELIADCQDEKLMITLRGNLTRQRGEALAEQFLARLPGARSVAVEHGLSFAVYGEPALYYRVGEYLYRVSPGSFFQASRHLLPELAEAVTRSRSGMLALDLYAGVGLFTLPLARSFKQVIGVECNERAARDLEANARRHHLDNVRVVGQSAYDFLRRFAQAESGLAVLDPPRAGVGAPTLQLLRRLRPLSVHYVSCYPPTLARDLGLLAGQGYTLNSIEMFDFFPQTAHIECLAILTRSDRAGS